MAYTSQIKKGTAVSGQIKKSTGLTAEARLGPPSGKDGFSPIANVTQTETGAVISITDKNGTTTATIVNGRNGDPGYTPVRGKDYYMEADKKEMVSEVIASLPIYQGEVVAE